MLTPSADFFPAAALCSRAAVFVSAPRHKPTALYTRPRSIYKTLGFDCWDIKRDATRFNGPGPVIAHPPCGHWGRYAHTCKLPGKHCGPIAIDQVRAFGGILEHPASSQLFEHCGISKTPGQHDLHGGQIIRVNQCDYGHAAQKDTLLYIVGLPGTPRLIPPMPHGTLRRLERLTEAQRNGTPLRFALLMLALFSQVSEDPNATPLAVGRQSCDPFARHLPTAPSYSNA